MFTITKNSENQLAITIFVKLIDEEDNSFFEGKLLKVKSNVSGNSLNYQRLTPKSRRSLLVSFAQLL